MQANDNKEASVYEWFVIKHVFNNCVEFATLVLKIVMVFIGSGIAINYISLGISHLYQDNSLFILCFSALVTVLLSFLFWFLMNCFNSVPHLGNRIDLTHKSVLKFNKILKITFGIKGAFYLVLVSYSSRYM